MASFKVIAGTTHDQRSRLLPCFQTSAIQRFHDLHSSISVSALAATGAIHMVLKRICTSMASLSMCFKRSSTSRSSRASGAVWSSRPVWLERAINSCSVNVGGRNPTDFPSTNQYCMLELSTELKSCGRNFFSDASRKSHVCSVSTTWASASTIMVCSLSERFAPLLPMKLTANFGPILPKRTHGSTGASHATSLATVWRFWQSWRWREFKLRQKTQVHQLLRRERFCFGIFQRSGIDDQLHAFDAHAGVVGQGFQIDLIGRLAHLPIPSLF